MLGIMRGVIASLIRIVGRECYNLERSCGIKYGQSASSVRVVSGLQALATELQSARPVHVVVCVFCMLIGCGFPAAPAPDRVNSAERLVDKGVVALRARDLERAHAAFSMAAEVAPIPSAHDGLGCVSLLQGDYVSSAESFRRALRIDPGYHRAIAHWALLEDLQGHRDNALSLYNHYLNHYPEAGYIRNNKAALEYERGGRRILLVQELHKALLVTPHAVIQANLDKAHQGDKGSHHN